MGNGWDFCARDTDLSCCVFYKVGAVINIGRLLGVMLFNISSYSALILLLLYIGLKLYNGVLSSLSLVPS